MKQAKKSLAKKPSPSKEKADKIHLDRFLNDLVKDEPDPDPNSFYEDDDPIEDIYSSDSENDTTSSENELETNTLSYSQSKPGSSKSSENESSSSESDLDEYEVNATKKK
ncbi:hypothetical protein F8M41_016873 [Gigaspora margarita]|uniref:Uncharacterized protein n=1 Tax=Gigaspora margarita TaxID=4874 RepID=A0A8H4ANR5_GIGMA|nr:hypothetical protein F8M41_016873 [Gigaspora margarita]